MSQRIVAARIGNHAERTRKVRPESFQTKFHRAVNRGMAEVLGAAGTQATSFHMGLRPTSGAAAVHDGLVRVFGAGAQALELSILHVLYSDLGSAFEPVESRTFLEYVSDAKKLRPPKGG